MFPAITLNDLWINQEGLLSFIKRACPLYVISWKINLPSILCLEKGIYPVFYSFTITDLAAVFAASSFLGPYYPGLFCRFLKSYEWILSFFVVFYIFMPWKGESALCFYMWSKKSILFLFIHSPSRAVFVPILGYILCHHLKWWMIHYQAYLVSFI